MQMSAAGHDITGFAHVRDHVALAHQVSHLQSLSVALQVGVVVDGPAIEIAFIERDPTQGAGIETNHDTARCGQHRCAGGGEDVDPLMAASAGPFLAIDKQKSGHWY